MSAYLLKPERIAQLADYIATLHNCGFDFFGYSMPEELHQELLDCRDIYGFMSSKKIFKKLFDLNAAAVAGRYNREQETAPEMPDVWPLHHPRERGKDETIDRWYDLILPWHYELLKLTQCFLYQCDEDATYQTPLFKALKTLEPLQMQHITTNQPEYIKAIWG